MGERMSLVVLLAVVIACCGSVRALQVFTVGGLEGWAVPSECGTDMYRYWASDKTFLIGDILEFRFKNDSLLLVSQDDYEKCNTADPFQAYYRRYARYRLDWSGYHHFISGKSGHCELGQKMAISVNPPKRLRFRVPPLKFEK